ncbi:MAG: deoxynucleoside kinase [bacterium]|nr:deoxynucleoside kinase [bacterium]
MGKVFVAVSGNMGAGKSTLVEKLAARLGWKPLFEPQDESPYLTDFYSDMKTWAFHSQLFFLGRRLKQYQDLLASPGGVLQDRCVYEDAEVFARYLFDRGMISPRDWETYQSIYRGVLRFLPPPDLLIYLQADLATLQGRIKRRGRSYEKGIDPEYLTGLQALYEGWIAGFRLAPVLVVPADWLDFVKEERHLDLIAEKIREKLSGHETLDFENP